MYSTQRAKNSITKGERCVATQSTSVSPKPLKMPASVENSQISHSKWKTKMLKQMQNFPTSMGEQRYWRQLCWCLTAYIFLWVFQSGWNIYYDHFLWTLGKLQACLYYWFPSTTCRCTSLFYKGEERLFDIYIYDIYIYTSLWIIFSYHNMQNTHLVNNKRSFIVSHIKQLLQKMCMKIHIRKWFV